MEILYFFSGNYLGNFSGIYSEKNLRIFFGKYFRIYFRNFSGNYLRNFLGIYSGKNLRIYLEFSSEIYFLIKNYHL